ncbi:MAG: 50S ribosomal protein L3 [Alphaproteobacteria bacterium]
MRTGLIAKKLGMTKVFTADGIHLPVTVLQCTECQVVQVKTKETDGYNAVQIGAGIAKLSSVSRSVKGHFAKNKIVPKSRLEEFRVSPEALLNVGDNLCVSHFLPGQYVDVTSTSIGKGFAGAMKRWNFGGLRASHGVSVSHRSHGSTGNRQDPGRVFKNKKMAGHLGSEQITTLNLQIVSVKPEDGIILVKGSVPGHDGTWVRLRDAAKKQKPDNLPYPAALKVASVVAVDAGSEGV